MSPQDTRLGGNRDNIERSNVKITSGDPICVLDSFESKEYEKMKRAKCRILGVPVILYCAEQRMLLPKTTYPLFSLVMMDVNVCCTGIQDRMELYTKVVMMGGQYSRNFTNEVTHLIAESSGSEKYKVALQLGTMVVHPKWVEDCWSRGFYEVFSGTDLAEQYRLASLIGCTICVTGIDEASRVKIENLTKEHGGIYSKDLVKQCTHLLAETPQGRKYEYAVKWNIKVVRSRWFFDCLRYRGVIDESRYTLSDKTGEDLACSSEIDDAAMLDGSSTNHRFYLEGLKIVLSEHFTSDKLQLMKKIILNGGGVRVTHSPSQVTHFVVANRRLGEKDVEFLRKLDSEPAIVSAKWLRDCYRQCSNLPTANYEIAKNQDDRSVCTREPECSRERSSLEIHNEPEILIPKRKSLPDEPPLSADFFSLFAPGATVPQKDAPKVETLEITEGIGSKLDHTKDNRADHGLFGGLTFIIEGFSDEHTLLISRTLRKQGGHVIDHNHLISNSERTTPVLIFPFMAEPPASGPMMMVTEFWLERCIDEHRLFDANDCILFRPCGLNQRLLSESELIGN
jgi:hypothetical protein